MRKNKDTVEECWTLEDVALARATMRGNNVKEFENRLAYYINAENVYVVPSARWGLWLEFSIIKELVGPGVVLVPSFNCSVVKDAIEGAGHAVYGYDFSEKVGRFDWAEVRSKLEEVRGAYNKRAVALIVTHYFGIPVDFREIIDYCHAEGIFVIEDCSHTLGGKLSGEPLGMLSDASVYSFNYDKPVSLGWGGALAIRNARLIPGSGMMNFVTPTVEYEYEALCRFVSAMDVRRKNINKKSILFRVSNKVLPRSRVSKFEMPQCGVGPLRSCLGILILKEYERIKQLRNTNAKQLKRLLSGCEFWYEATNVEPATLKLKMNAGFKARATSKKLQGKGYRVGNFNWPQLIDSKTNCPFASDAASHWIDIPVHQNMTYKNIKELATCIKRFAAEC